MMTHPDLLRDKKSKGVGGKRGAESINHPRLCCRWNQPIPWDKGVIRGWRRFTEGPFQVRPRSARLESSRSNPNPPVVGGPGRGVCERKHIQQVIVPRRETRLPRPQKGSNTQ